jgi:SNF2 family DNA or RNA helicase
MVLIMLQMALGSSAAAAGAMLRGLAEQSRLAPDTRARLQELADAAARIDAGAKFEHLLRLVRDFGGGREKLVIFTQFRATQDRLARFLANSAEHVAVFHGGLSRLEKEAAIAEFRGPARLLLATEAGSEGRNLQFAHAVCNFDLPWNPMKIEQRIGRLSRIGQQHDVHVFNFVAAGTVESAVLHLLEAKVHMFELVIGEIDMILGNLDDEREFPEVVADLWIGSSDAGDFERRMELLGEKLLAAKQAYFIQRDHDDRLFGNHFAPQG